MIWIKIISSAFILNFVISGKFFFQVNTLTDMVINNLLIIFITKKS